MNVKWMVQNVTESLFFRPGDLTLAFQLYYPSPAQFPTTKKSISWLLISISAAQIWNI